MPLYTPDPPQSAGPILGERLPRKGEREVKLTPSETWRTYPENHDLEVNERGQLRTKSTPLVGLVVTAEDTQMFANDTAQWYRSLSVDLGVNDDVSFYTAECGSGGFQIEPFAQQVKPMQDMINELQKQMIEMASLQTAPPLLVGVPDRESLPAKIRLGDNHK